MSGVDWLDIEGPYANAASRIAKYPVMGDSGGYRDVPLQEHIRPKEGVTKAQVRFLDGNSKVRISGNPVKLATKQNVIGTQSVIGAAVSMLNQVSAKLAHHPTQPELNRWKAGDFNVHKIQIAGYLDFGKRENAEVFVRKLRRFIAAQPVNMHAKRKLANVHYTVEKVDFSFYLKAVELRKHTRLPDLIRNDRKLMAFIARSVRCEITLEGQTLRNMGLAKGRDWKGVDLEELLRTQLRTKGLPHFPQVCRAAIPKATGKDRIILLAHQNQVDVLASLPRSTRGRWKQHFLKEYGVDLSTIGITQKQAAVIYDGIEKAKLRVGAPKRYRNWEPLAPLRKKAFKVKA